MKKKGFTLMELLAVIVILAVLALLVIPITTNLIKTSKQQAFKISVGQVSDNIYFHYTKDWLLEGMTEDKVFDFDTNENTNLLTLSGQLPTGGTITINPQGKISINVNNGVYCAVKTIDQDSIQVGEIVNGACEITGEEIDTCPYEIGHSWDFDYITTGTDRSQEFNILCSGNYKLEVWGAEGGNYDANNRGGAGAYSTGIINLAKNSKIYINIGGQGQRCESLECAGGYNGGGSGYTNQQIASSGGGATHIGYDTGLLSSFENKIDKLIIVAAGGGGTGLGASESNYMGYGGSGGGTSGNNGISLMEQYDGNYGGTGGNQSSGGREENGAQCGGYTTLSISSGSFGQGGNYADEGCGGSGGGGGYYGGGGSLRGHNGAGGGSGYIGNSSLTSKYMYCNNCTTSLNKSDYTISEGTNSCSSENPISDCAKKNNGYARITYVGKTVCNITYGETWDFDYISTGIDRSQNLIVPCNGDYKLEVWGAEGGNYDTTNRGGFGGYSTGTIYLNKNTTLYINVGGQGQKCESLECNGGYNGGGSGYTNQQTASSGGGATHIALASGLLTTFNPASENSIHDKLIIVAGGGGGTGLGASDSNYIGYGGSGGGISGNGGISLISGYAGKFGGTGGNQSTGGTKENGTICGTAPDYQYEGSFGQGGSFADSGCGSSGGGGGYYGGGGSVRGHNGAGGGSGYIGNNDLKNKFMYCYNCQTSPATNINTYTKSNGTNSCNNANPISECSKQGNGYAKITYVKIK